MPLQDGGKGVSAGGMQRKNHMVVQKRNIVAYSAVIAGSIVMLAWVIPHWSPEYPGYGVPASLVPNASCGLMLLLAALGLVKELWALRQNRAETGAPQKQAAACHWLHLAKFLVPGLLLMPAAHVVGFIPAGIAFLLIVQFFCGQRRAVPLVLVSVLPVLAVYAIARYGLSVPMP